jgi:hypothetical protein
MTIFNYYICSKESWLSSFFSLVCYNNLDTELMPHAIPVEGNYYTDPGNLKMFPFSIQIDETTGYGYIPGNQVMDNHELPESSTIGIIYARAIANTPCLKGGIGALPTVAELKASLACSAEGKAIKNLKEILERQKKLPSANTITGISRLLA